MMSSEIKSETAFRTISEVAEELGVQQHVLRFWETKFSQIKPMKRGGGRRYYRPEDVAMVRKIHSLLYVEGYTIKGVQKLLKGSAKAQVATEPKVIEQKTQAHGQNMPQIKVQERPAPATKSGEEQVEALQSVLEELLDMREQVRQLIDSDTRVA